MTEQEIKERTKNTFDLVSGGYDRPELRFFDSSAKELVGMLSIKGHERILDVCTGTGHVVKYLLPRVRTGSVTGIDISDNMIAVAQNKFKNPRVSTGFIVCDLENFHSTVTFDIITCAFGIFFLPDMGRALQRMQALLAPGGTLILSSFDSGFMEPQHSLFIERLLACGVPVTRSFWVTINSEEKLRQLLSLAGFSEIQIERRECGYALANVEEWWNVIYNTNMRSNLSAFSGEALARFKQEHLEQVHSLDTAAGIPLAVPVLYAKMKK